jgi:XTP/dITP diphosphohydrolase
VRRVVLATQNPDKAREIEAILGSVSGLEVLSRPEDLGDVEETGTSLEENALIKARAVVAAAGGAAIADDTGLFVDALDGAPGVYSARFAGPDATYDDNVRKLLNELKAAPAPRRARFATVAAFVDVDGDDVVVTGELHGEIAMAPRGSGGFGYDSVFIPHDADARGRTLAELGAEEKDAISHRGRAFRELAVRLGGEA